MTMAVSTELTILIVIFYLVLILGLGYYGYRKTTKVEDYMVAGRNTHPMVIALSYGATFISNQYIGNCGVWRNGSTVWYELDVAYGAVYCSRCDNCIPVHGKAYPSYWEGTRGTNIS